MSPTSVVSIRAYIVLSNFLGSVMRTEKKMIIAESMRSASVNPLTPMVKYMPIEGARANVVTESWPPRVVVREPQDAVDQNQEEHKC